MTVGVKNMQKAFLFGFVGVFLYGCAVMGIWKDDGMTPPLNVFPGDYPVRLVSVEQDPVFKDMLRPQERGWLGSDAAHSIPLGDGRFLWLFGDTLIGTMARGARVVGAEFIHNTIGIQEIRDSLPGTMRYYWETREGKSFDFFPPQVEKHYIKNPKQVFNWPTMGFMLQGELFILAYRLEVGENDQCVIPTTLIRVPNPRDSPDLWIKKSFDLGLGNDHQGFLSAVYIKEPYVYFLGYDDQEEKDWARRAVLARAKISDIMGGRLGEVFEFWVKGQDGPKWGTEPKNLVTLFEPGITETDIQYVPEWGLYFCTTYTYEHPNIYITVAPELTGPWTRPVSIYKVPEHARSFPTSAYAARPHPEFSTKPGELIISYATNINTMDLDPLFIKEGAEIYYPRFIRVQFELGGKSLVPEIKGCKP